MPSLAAVAEAIGVAVEVIQEYASVAKELTQARELYPNVESFVNKVSRGMNLSRAVARQLWSVAGYFADQGEILQSLYGAGGVIPTALARETERYTEDFGTLSPYRYEYKVTFVDETTGDLYYRSIFLPSSYPIDLEEASYQVEQMAASMVESGYFKEFGAEAEHIRVQAVELTGFTHFTPGV